MAAGILGSSTVRFLRDWLVRGTAPAKFRNALS